VLVVVQQESLAAQAYSETVLGVAVIIVLLVVPGGLAAAPRRVGGAVSRARARRLEAATGATAPHQSPAPSSAGTPREG
jgi:hypothetical protein